MSVLGLLTAVVLQGASVAPATLPRVELDTSAGRLLLEIDTRQAPATGCNFLRYVRARSYTGGRFHRTVRSDRPMGNANPIDVVQAETPAGSDDPGFGPIALERTGKTGLRHVAGALSMARDGPDTATSSFFIVIRDTPSLDQGGARNPDGQGFAVFGRVLQGMDVARRIQQGPVKPETEQLTPAPAIRSARVAAPGDPVLACPA